MTFSASMSVVEYYLLKRFPVPYGNRNFRYVLSFTQNLSEGTYPVPSLTLLNWFLYALKSIPFSSSDSREHYLAFWVAALFFVAVATVAAFIGQHAVRKLINILGRASLIIFILAFTIFVSAISLGKNTERNHLSGLKYLRVPLTCSRKIFGESCRWSRHF